MEKGKAYSREELEKNSLGMGNIHVIVYKEKSIISRNIEKSILINKHLGEPLEIIDMKTESQNIAIHDYEIMKTTIKIKEHDDFYITTITTPTVIYKKDK